MYEYEFVFVLDGISLDDHDAVRSLSENLGALVSTFHGVPRMSVSGEGKSAVAAAFAVVKRAYELVPSMRIVRLDRDMVGVSDIAELTGRTRQNVTQWVHGQRHDGVPFPRPETVVGRSLAWLWPEVNEWLRGLDLDDGLNWPTRDEMTEIDWGLRNFRAIRLNLVLHSDGADVRRIARHLAEHARTNPEFIRYLLVNPQVCDAGGKYTVFVCSPRNEAVEVFRRLDSFPHPVVLATVSGKRIHAFVMEGDEDEGGETTELVPGMTVRDWLGMIALSPGRGFTVARRGGTAGAATIAARSPMDLVGA
ncbi:putative DNA-binding transcriptional regulator AlpA [Nocardiopsis arvandica]|uniref:Putative DNA-binding transcriptional regulator AlpA n=1 Tax=Nocardiopsis sinuspersici TaxID=501010 RepID=A0A7Y9XFK4_9ACTN|nr:putative DNA-binding transcriptional regulator AlpA [Nocardiopsis sinuspersici]